MYLVVYKYMVTVRMALRKYVCFTFSGHVTTSWPDVQLQIMAEIRPHPVREIFTHNNCLCTLYGHSTKMRLITPTAGAQTAE